MVHKCISVHMLSYWNTKMTENGNKTDISQCVKIICIMSLSSSVHNFTGAFVPEYSRWVRVTSNNVSVMQYPSAPRSAESRDAISNDAEI